MASVLGALRRLSLTPSLESVGFAARLFPGAGAPAATGLEAIPQAVVCGFEWAIESRDLWETERRLALVEPEVRGFAYEGATMAAVVRDAMGGRRHGHTRELLLGPGRPHVFLAYIGVGFAMAKLPRVLWPSVLPEMDGLRYHPTMSWLAVDGFGFDLAYFDTARYVHRQEVPAAYAWEGSPGYFLRAVDQGIGRCLWFVHAADVDAVTVAVRKFAPHRHADLWSGVGLAASVAGGADEAGLRILHAAAGEHGTELGLGAVFAAKARTWAGFVPARTDAACAAFGVGSVRAAVELADATEPPAGDGTGDHPAYEIWRSRIRAALAAAPRLRVAG